ncbi:hypothetical protein OK074_0920 [Actinobacteria bacterium OK074]|nr:hypothetical protein OK074_0920 [Actinobacteria bacterium OK074]
MSGSRSNSAERRVAAEHLGDRLSALVDGELGHESRERVLAHLATCPKCKAEADAQRRLKNVFAEVAPPPPSESFLARLQGLPGGGDTEGDGDNGSDSGGSPLTGGVFGGRLPGGGRPPGAAKGSRPARPSVFSGFSGFPGFPGRSTGFLGGTGAFAVPELPDEPFGYDPAGPHGTGLPPADESALPGAPELPGGRGFRIHHVGRPDTERSSSFGMRFVFVAAGAVSLAAITLGGVSGVTTTDTAADARGGSGTGSNVTPVRPPGSGSAAAPDSQRRRTGLAGSAVLGQGRRMPGETPVASIRASAPLLPGIPSPAASQDTGDGATGSESDSRALEVMHTLTAPVVAGAAAMSPLIRPLTDTTPLTSDTVVTDPDSVTAGLLPSPQPMSSPSASPPDTN